VALAARRRQPIAVPALWLAAAVVGFNLGALYWRHYYVQLVPPLALLGGLAVTSIRSPLYRAVALALALLPVAAALGGLAVASSEDRESRIAHRRQFEDHQRIAAQLEERFEPNDTIYVLVSEADLYFVVGRPARYPYLWGHPVQEIPGALEELRELLSSERRPEWLVQYHAPNRVDPSGRLRRIVERHYEYDPTVASDRARIHRAR
jgi:hypothetical protein